MADRAGDEVTLLLERVRGGDAAARDELYPLVYRELRDLAGSWFRRQGSDHTLQATALVHEAWIKLADVPAATIEHRAHFFALAARTMRQVLVDHARARSAEKRGGDRTPITYVDVPGGGGLETLDLLALEEALERLARRSELKARIVELRFFGGLGGDEIALVLGISPSSVDREWRFTRAWLAEELAEDGGS